MSQITTHILDTSKGTPASGILIILYNGQDDDWKEIAKGITNADGRISDFLTKNALLPHGIYKMRFEVADYFASDDTQTFYPYIEIIFEINNDEHYHIPLLLNPFGYSTYRGS